MIRFAGRKMYTIFIFSLFVLFVSSDPVLVPKPLCIMENIQVDLPFIAENLNGVKIVPEISISAVN
jgi:hypothetical protein